MKILILFAVLAICHAVPMANFQDGWVNFKASHGKTYKTPTEEHYRMKIWLDNSKMIEEHNNNYEKGLTTFHMKMNHFGDLTGNEFKTLMNKYNTSGLRKARGGSLFLAPAYTGVPETVDWRQKGAVTPVKDQGQCGSCWAFSTTGSLEGQTFRKTGKLVSLSEQQLVDCSGSTGNEGCNGGLMDDAFRYIKSAGGIESEDSYPYEGEDGSCRFKKSDVVSTDSGFVDVPQSDEDALKKAVATVGPVSVAIDAGQNSFQFYSGGVYYEKYCSSDDLDHGVLVVGYGSDSGHDYWLVKNSWNTGWGEEGYIKMARNKNNHCGIATSASYPLV